MLRSTALFLLLAVEPVAATDDFQASLQRRYAEGQLGQCPSTMSAEGRVICEMDRARFPQDYVDAHRGDYLAQGRVAGALSSGNRGAVRVDRIDACAWQIVVTDHPRARPTDRSMLEAMCGALPAGLRRDAVTRSRQIQDAIRPAPEPRQGAR